MLSSSAIRPARAFALRFQPGLLAAPCTTASASPFTSSKQSPATAARPQPAFFASPLQIAVRHASSSAPSSTTASARSQPAAAAPSSAQLTWNDFLTLRRTRRKISVFASSISAVATTFAGLRVFIEQGYDSSLSASFGLDPVMVTGLSAIGMLAVGWLIGPFFGNAAFNLRYRSIRGEIERKEREFYNRIKRHRVDPTSSSMANPVPDYYGEKIGSVAGYRRWLKDQRAFNLKTGVYKGNNKQR
ncbi:Pam17-domain-containing protein [Corynespora cassiicola Philippines]|uniref:Presequence translocated-associated motor subunit PAM17 n=1 Tax=Corynespora cassiicola Philippines TaxID=1448308 RepID=A0A2T2N4S9_CORCC|nr:Pam17-domain-containing protein [Corynespora cassiicola Philippines]